MHFNLSTILLVSSVIGSALSTSLPTKAGFIVQSSENGLFEARLNGFETGATQAIEELVQEPFNDFIDTLQTSLIDFNEAMIGQSSNLDEYTQSVLELADAMNAFKPLSSTDQNHITREFLTTKREYQFGHNQPTKLLTPIEANWIRVNNKTKYFDITDMDDIDGLDWAKKLKYKVGIPKNPSHIKQVESIGIRLDEGYMKKFLTKLTSFYNRYYQSKNGVDSSKFIYDTLSKIVADNSATPYVTLNYFKHSWAQSSIIARIQGTSDSDDVVIVGAHQDSVNQWIPWFGKAPGADDDGSGTTSTISAFKAIIESKFKPNRTLEFHWYAAEEAGLLGSQDIAKSYSHQRKPVVAMMHFDMSGHFKGKEQIAVVQDYTDPDLSNLLRKLIDQYTDLPRIDSRCGYACSDHASWNKFGFRSAFPIEDPDIESNPYIHSTGDTVETINFHHVHQFARLAIAFGVELSA